MSYLIALWIIGIIWLLISIRNDALFEWGYPTPNLVILCLYFIFLFFVSAFLPVRDYKEIEVPFETFEFKDKTTYYVNEAGKSYANGIVIEKGQKVYRTSEKSLFGLEFNEKIIK
jgi:hypothetical protein